MARMLWSSTVAAVLAVLLLAPAVARAGGFSVGIQIGRPHAFGRHPGFGHFGAHRHRHHFHRFRHPGFAPRFHGFKHHGRHHFRHPGHGAVLVTPGYWYWTGSVWIWVPR